MHIQDIPKHQGEWVLAVKCSPSSNKKFLDRQGLTREQTKSHENGTFGCGVDHTDMLCNPVLDNPS